MQIKSVKVWKIRTICSRKRNDFIQPVWHLNKKNQKQKQNSWASDLKADRKLPVYLLFSYVCFIPFALIICKHRLIIQSSHWNPMIASTRLISLESDINVIKGWAPLMLLKDNKIAFTLFCATCSFFH